MRQKILTIIYNPKINKFLLLKMQKHPYHSPTGGWFTVTGGVKSNEDPLNAVIRELKEETGLNAIKIFNLNWGSTYNWKGKEFIEANYLSFVNETEITLNEEHSDYKWLDLDDFIKKIDWYDNKELLKKVLIRGINGKVYFDKIERGN